MRSKRLARRHPRPARQRPTGSPPLSVSRHTGYNLIGLLLPVAISLVTVADLPAPSGPRTVTGRSGDRPGCCSAISALFDLGLGRATSFRIASLKSASPEARASTFWGGGRRGIWPMGGVGPGLALWAAAGPVLRATSSRWTKRSARKSWPPYPSWPRSVPVATITGVLTGAVQGRERFLEINIVSVVSTALFQLLPLAVAWKFRTGPGLGP